MNPSLHGEVLIGVVVSLRLFTFSSIPDIRPFNTPLSLAASSLRSSEPACIPLFVRLFQRFPQLSSSLPRVASRAVGAIVGVTLRSDECGGRVTSWRWFLRLGEVKRASGEVLFEHNREPLSA